MSQEIQHGELKLNMYEDTTSKPNFPPIPKPNIPSKNSGETPLKDKYLFPGGPLISEIEAWKKQFDEVYATEVGVEVFIWRPLNRYEYKYIASQPGTTELIREELICQQCVLWPKEYDIEQMVNGKAGVPALLADQIMKASGFLPTSAPRLL